MIVCIYVGKGKALNPFLQHCGPFFLRSFHTYQFGCTLFKGFILGSVMCNWNLYGAVPFSFFLCNVAKYLSYPYGNFPFFIYICGCFQTYIRILER